MSRGTFENLIGKCYERLTVISRELSYKNGTSSRSVWLCKCSCGTEKVVHGAHLKSGHVKSCGCLRAQRQGERVRLRPYESLYNSFLRNSLKREISVNLTYEDFVKFTEINECLYCGSKVGWSMYVNPEKGRGHKYNLDRKKNNIGYTKDNCIVCCTRCNFGKSNYFTYEQWLSIGQHIKANPELFG